MTLVKSISIEALLQRRNAIVCELTKIHECTQRIKEVVPSINMMLTQKTFGLHNLNIDTAFSETERNGYRDKAPFQEKAGLDYAIKTLDSSLWKILMHESGMLTFMNDDARRKLDDQIHRNQLPPLTLENIESTFSGLNDNKIDMFEKGVCQIAEKLNRNYKTNKIHKFDKKIIMNCAYAYHSQVGQLDDLDRALHIISGKPERDSRNGLQSQFNSFRERPYFIETEHLGMYVYKNMNAHITFKDLAHVDKLNAIIAKHYPNAIANEVRK